MTPQAATATEPAKTSAIAKRAEPLNVFDQIQQVYDSIAKRAFNIFERNGRWFGRDLSDWFQAEAELLHPMHLEIADSDDALTVRAEVPGFAAKELEIHVDSRRLTIAGKHETKEETKKGKTIYSEQCAKELFRSVDLPSEVDSSKVSATLKDGVLNIELPKAPHAKSVRVEPKAAS